MTVSNIEFTGMEFPSVEAPPVHPPFDIPVKEVANEPSEAEGFVLRNAESLVIGPDPVIIHKTDIDQWVFHLLQCMTQSLGPTVLAGGAIRDLCVGVDPSDYDLFTVGSFNEAISALSEIKWVEQGSIRQVVADGGAKGPEYSGNIHYVLEFFVDFVDQPIQLIGVDNIQDEVCQQFPVGASRCILSPQGFSCTHSFLRDMYREQFTVMNVSTLRSHYVKKLQLREEFLKWPWIL